MAVTTVTTTMAGAINYTVVTDTSADWPSVANSTYFYDKATKLVYFKNSGGTILEIFSAGGLTNFTEAANSSAPNGTVPVNSLTATGAATNIDAAIIPKGTGALLANIPDNTATGGNKRGEYAVDWQLARETWNFRVASGNYSVISGGRSNTASGLYSSVIGGRLCQATGDNSIAGGGGVASGSSSVGLGNSTASGANSFAMGDSNTASGNGGSMCIGRSSTSSGDGAQSLGAFNTSSSIRSITIGESNIASAPNTAAIGRENTANAEYSFAFGFGSHVFGIKHRIAKAGGYISTIGDSQSSTFILKRRTTGNTATTLTTNNASADSTNQLILSNQSAYRFKGSIVGKQSGSTNAAVWDIDGFIVRGANAAATTLNVSNVTLVENTPAWGTPTLAADTTNGGLQVQVTGAAATNIQWTAVIETTEVIYA